MAMMMMMMMMTMMVMMAMTLTVTVMMIMWMKISNGVNCFGGISPYLIDIETFLTYPL